MVCTPQPCPQLVPALSTTNTTCSVAKVSGCGARCGSRLAGRRKPPSWRACGSLTAVLREQFRGRATGACPPMASEGGRARHSWVWKLRCQRLYNAPTTLWGCGAWPPGRSGRAQGRSAGQEGRKRARPAGAAGRRRRPQEPQEPQEAGRAGGPSCGERGAQPAGGASRPARAGARRRRGDRNRAGRAGGWAPRGGRSRIPASMVGAGQGLERRGGSRGGAPRRGITR
jgi:hypothetical protein